MATLMKLPLKVDRSASSISRGGIENEGRTRPAGQALAVLTPSPNPLISLFRRRDDDRSEQGRKFTEADWLSIWLAHGAIFSSSLSSSLPPFPVTFLDLLFISFKVFLVYRPGLVPIVPRFFLRSCVSLSLSLFRHANIDI